MKVVSDWNIRTIYTVVARIKGGDYPDEWIIRGNHHDTNENRSNLCVPAATCGG